MAKDFNVYQWRRNHLNEGNQNPSLKAAMEEWFGSSTPTKEEMMNFVEWFYNQDASEPSMFGGLNENLEIGNEYAKEEVASMFDQIYWKATNKLDKEDILALPFDKIRYFGMYPPRANSALPNFVSPKGPDQPARTDDSWIAVAYAADKAAGIRPGLD